MAANTKSDPKTNTAQMRFSLEITDVDQLSRVLNRVGQLNNVMEVRRERK